MRPRSRPAAARTPGTAAAHPPPGPGRALGAMAPATRQQPACLPPGEAELAESASERLRLRASDCARSLLRGEGLNGGSSPLGLALYSSSLTHNRMRQQRVGHVRLVAVWPAWTLTGKVRLVELKVS